MGHHGNLCIAEWYEKRKKKWNQWWWRQSMLNYCHYRHFIETISTQQQQQKTNQIFDIRSRLVSSSIYINISVKIQTIWNKFSRNLTSKKYWFRCAKTKRKYQLTFNMCKSTEYATRTIASLLNVIAFCWFINFWMKLLLRSGVAILTIITSFTISWFTPFLAMLYIRTRGGSVNVDVTTKKCVNFIFHFVYL